MDPFDPAAIDAWVNRTRDIPFTQTSTLYQHIERLRINLNRWGAPNWVVNAGLLSPAYGNQFFDPAPELVTSREEVQALIGKSAELIVLIFSTLNRRRAGIDGTYMDRTSGKVLVHMYTTDNMPLRDAINLVEAADLLASARRLAPNLASRLTLNTLTPPITFGVHEIERRTEELDNYYGY